MALTKVKELILHSVSELHRKSIETSDKQWFRRAEIATQMGAPSGHLNPARIGALEEMVVAGLVLKQQKPDDGRNLPLYRIP